MVLRFKQWGNRGATLVSGVVFRAMPVAAVHFLCGRYQGSLNWFIIKWTPCVVCVRARLGSKGVWGGVGVVVITDKVDMAHASDPFHAVYTR